MTLTQTPLKNHPGMWLDADAAASLDRVEAEHGVFKINSAGRTKGEQDALNERWAKGGAANRPPYLYKPAPSTGPNISWHQRGLAADTPEIARFRSAAADHGWRFEVAGDLVHAQYHPELDKHRGGGGGGLVFSQTVANEQAWLNASRGAGLKVDGLRGPKTIEAYKAYQSFLRAYGYTGAIDGIWGAGTQAAHAVYYEAQHAAAPVPASAGRELSYADIQAGLNKFGYGLAVDGIWGKKSHNALGDFQSRHGLLRDYLVGPKTRAALGI